MRVFLDTNVLVAAFATRGLCSDLLALTLAEHELLAGERLLAELGGVLERKLGLPRATLDEIETLLRDQAVAIARVARVEHAADLPVDADDAWILAEAAAAAAEVFVTGDRELLQAEIDLPFPRLAPRAFWERLRTS